MRRVLLFLLVIAYFGLFRCGVMASSDVDLSEALLIANQEVRTIFGKSYDYYPNELFLPDGSVMQINQDIFNSKKMIVYGYPSGSIGHNGERRYIGLAPNMERVPNPNYPDDEIGYLDIDDKNFYSKPWEDTYIKSLPLFNGINDNDFTPKRADYLEHFLAGMEVQHPSRFRGDRSKPWTDYYHITVPPTQYTDGIAWVIWKNTNGSVHYATSLMRATSKLNLLTASCNINAPLTVDETTTSISATFEIDMSGLDGITSYEIINVSPNITVSGPLNVLLPAGTRNLSDSIPITIDIVGNSTAATLGIKVFDASGNETMATANTVITKLVVNIAATGFTPGGVGVIAADFRGAERFDVSQGIPTTEDLYVNTIVDEYIFEEEYQNVTGAKTYTVRVSKEYDYSWWDNDDVKIDLNSDGDYDDLGETTGGYDYDSNDPPVVKTYTVPKSYSYYLIDRLELYGLKKALIINGALPGGSRTLLPNGYTLPIASVIESDMEANHLQETTLKSLALLNSTNNVYQSVSYDPVADIYDIVLKTSNIGGSSYSSKPSQPNEDFTASADFALSDVKVRNDEIIINGVISMDGTWYDGTTPAPAGIPSPARTDGDVLYESGLTIPTTIRNGIHISSGQVEYERIVSVNSSFDATILQPIDSLNDVTVHSPVVCYADIVEDLTFNQVMDKDLTRTNVIIDQAFQVEFPNDGMHQGYPGYGDRDYSAYTLTKQVKFTFDAYYGSDRTGTYIEMDEWFSVPITDVSPTFFIPHWVEEGDQTVLFRSFANNTPVNFANTWAYDANLTNDKYYAVTAEEVKTVGQIYNFSIIGTTDDNFSEFFYDPTGIRLKTLATGTMTKEGIVDPLATDILPLLPGTNTLPGLGNKVLKKGHSVFFSVEVNGNMREQDDFVLVRPTFYHVDDAGNNRQQVDLWYTKQNRLISLIDEPVTLKMALNNEFTALDKSILSNTARGNVALRGLDGRTNLSDYTDNYLYSTSKQAENIGATDYLALDYKQRLFVGDTTNIPSNVASNDALTGTQSYIGMYTVPSTTLAVPFGTSVTDVLTDKIAGGYLIVSFSIESIDGFTGDPTDTHLSYSEGAGDMFQIQGYDQSQNGFTLNYGDTVFYYLDKSVNQDFTNIGTH